jgi:hypothetical protein
LLHVAPDGKLTLLRWLMNTEVTYLYRDAGNYKFWGRFVVLGAFSPSMVEKYLIDGMFFVPKAIGLEPLATGARNDDDHEWHTFEECAPTGSDPTVMSAHELVRRIKRAHDAGWGYGLR